MKSLLDEIKTIFHNFCNALYIKIYKKKTIAKLQNKKCQS